MCTWNPGYSRVTRVAAFNPRVLTFDLISGKESLCRVLFLVFSHCFPLLACLLAAQPLPPSGSLIPPSTRHLLQQRESKRPLLPEAACGEFKRCSSTCRELFPSRLDT